MLAILIILASVNTFFTSKMHKATVDSGLSVYCEPISTFKELVTDSWFDSYDLETKDNYLVTLFRVKKYIKGTKEPSKDGKPILLIHGLLDSADDWALSDDSLVPVLVEKGYDVWLLNSRGNKYSCGHTKIEPEMPKFWDYSFEDMAREDFPTTLDFIYQKTGQKVLVVGHSQGSTQVFAALASEPRLNEKIERFFAVAPVVYMTGFEKGNMWHYMATHHYVLFLQSLGIHRVLERKLNNNWFEDKLIRAFCTTSPQVCAFLISKICDRDPKMMDLEEMGVFLEHNPSRTSLKTFEHYTQMIISDDHQLRKFDYGEAENRRRYNSSIPPAYDMKNIDVKVYMYYGDNDVLTTVKAAELLKATLKSSSSRFYKGWGHLSYFFGKARHSFFEDILTDIDASVNETKTYEN